MADASPPRPRFQPPRQARSERTLRRIVDAAEALVVECGVDGTTVQAVVERAGVSTGSFYARFDGRDALIHFLHNRFWEEAEAQWRAFLDPGRWEGAPPVVLVGELARILIRSHSVNSGPLRAFLVHALAHPEEKPLRRTARLDEGVADRVAALLASHADSIDHVHPGLAIRVATRQLLATLRGAVLFGEEGRLALPTGSEEEAVVELTRAFLGYLGLPGAPSDYESLRLAVARYRESRLAT